MNCAVHPDKEASWYCRNCGKPMCEDCSRKIRDIVYCEDCLAQVMGLPAPQPAAPAGIPGAAPLAPSAYSASAPAARPSHPNPVLAFILGFVPGLGAIYNGEYNKAIVHILIFAGIIVGITGAFGEGIEGFWIVSLIVFNFYMAIDALRVAKAKQSGQALQDPLANWTQNRALGPYILIGIGGLFLMRNFGIFDFFEVRRIFWPIVLIGIGFLMLRNRVGGQN